MITDYKVGDRVYYILPRGYGRPQTVYLPITIINITSKRIVIRPEYKSSRRINTLPNHLTRELPK